MAPGGGVLGGAGGKKVRSKKDDAAKKSLRPGDLPPRRGRDWNPGAGPRPSLGDAEEAEQADGGGGGDGVKRGGGREYDHRDNGNTERY